jgi:hypothetical protein
MVNISRCVEKSQGMLQATRRFVTLPFETTEDKLRTALR